MNELKKAIDTLKKTIKETIHQLEEDYEMSYEDMYECYLKNSETFKMYHEHYHIGVSYVEGMVKGLKLMEDMKNDGTL
tara:strand:- start:512 stop:745 length:234 start_codon:yes stop_codon:yes gene_type:complete